MLLQIGVGMTINTLILVGRPRRMGEHRAVRIWYRRVQRCFCQDIAVAGEAVDSILRRARLVYPDGICSRRERPARTAAFRAGILAITAVCEDEKKRGKCQCSGRFSDDMLHSLPFVGLTVERYKVTSTLRP